MKKIGVICLALVLALGTLGAAFALWSENLSVDATVKTAEVDWEFTSFTSVKDQGYDWTGDLQVSSVLTMMYRIRTLAPLPVL